MKTISTKELQDRLEAGEQLNVIDVREDDEVAIGMIEGAKHIPLGEVEERANELDAGQEYFLVCRAGRRSEMACGILEEKGFQTVNVEGGMTDWAGETIA